ncbi:MAG TPA: MTH1187 family thiamine-binding protein [Actinobacteria bacterium]|nr:MTH1187 family thiamine-binding protein [Actinomycetota bacterium]
MALMSISVVPLGTPTLSIGDYIAKIVRTLDEGEVKYKLTDMGTIVEGEARHLFKIAHKLHETPFTEGVLRVITTIEIDDRRDKEVKLEDKVKSVRARLK